ncbi:helix-turn-helix transcriptional regulator [Maribacter sp. ACAM166]|uniref:helix-turn-helix transcriptional regulator n=1 Tax=Maribacter sp. ACAM166 TaxID=2508996 RepID=UPI0010FD8C7E|nr:AraC family transcriptional regulator [Maribacter sp. ACAM166]TLP70620.1 helix-turn-helix transcriptional regulator [Maribacter sp. ACAM166]
MSIRRELKELNVLDVVKDIAKRLNVDYEEENNEICLDIPEEAGTGHIKAISFSHGVGLMDVDIRLKKEVRFALNQSLVQPLEIVFNRETTILHEFEGQEKQKEINHLESAIFSCNGKYGNVLTMKANESICFFNLEINRKLFEEKIESFLPEMNEDIESLFRDVNGINLFFHKGHYSLDIAQCIEEINESEDTGFTKSVFVEGKCYEILAHHLRQYVNDSSPDEKRTILRQSTVVKIEEAAGIIDGNLEQAPSILNLSKKVGLNQNTLQNGFQTLFRLSVKEYTQNKRMEMARHLMETTSLNITEITYRIGINSRSYFSKLFKQRYAMTPKQYLQKLESGDQSKKKTS